MKTIILFRHGKSDWKADYDEDHERPLAKRGDKAARRMGEFLARSGQVPERILSSSAVRARETVRLATESGGWTCPVTIEPLLYAASPGDVLDRIRTEPDDVASLMLAGHEPAWSELASALTGGGALRFPTAAMARIDMDAESWSEVETGRGELIWFIVPRLLKNLVLDR